MKKILKFTAFFLAFILLINIFIAYKVLTRYRHDFYADNLYFYSTLDLISNLYRAELHKTFSLTNFEKDKLSSMCEVNLIIPQESIQKLEADLPKSMDTYVDGVFQHGDESYEMKVKYRGDSSHHWLKDNKSYKIRLKDNGTFLGTSDFSFVRIETNSDISEAIGYQSGKELGLITQNMELIPVCLNGEYLELYNYVERKDKGFMEKQGLTYDDLFEGDMMDLLTLTGINKSLFFNPFYWEISSQDVFKYSNYQPLFILLSALNTYTNEHDVESIITMRNLNNEQYLAKFMAFTTLIQTSHYDLKHNLKFYFDRTSGEFEQIVDDPIAWSIITLYPTITQGVAVMDIISNAYYSALHNDPVFVHNKQVELFQMMHDLDIDTLSVKIQSDIDKFSPFFDDIEMSDSYVFLKNVQAVYKSLDYQLHDQDICYSTQGNKLIVDSFGFTAKRIIALSFENEDQGGWTNFSRAEPFDIPTDIFGEILYPGRRYLLEDEVIAKYKHFFDVEYSPNTNISFLLTNTLFPADLVYTFDSEKSLESLKSIEFKNVITGETFVRSADPTCATESTATHTVHPWDIEKFLAERPLEYRPLVFQDDPFNFKYLGYKSAAPQAFVERYPDFSLGEDGIVLRRGSYQLDQTVVVPENTKLTIEPGTTIQMAEGVSLLSYSPVFALGTEDEPITVTALDPEKPFGVFAVEGDGASGSHFNHFDISYGYETTINGIYFSGMFSIYHANDVIVENSRITHGTADDGINIKFSNGIIRNSIISENFADGIDFDSMSGEISNNLFENNGNDSIDMSMSSTYIHDNEIYNSGDKCISVGEKTTAKIENNLLQGCHIGIEAKDLSTPLIINNQIIGNEMGINSYQKKDFFGGAHAVVQNTTFQDNKEDITFENTFEGKRLDTDDSTIELDGELITEN